MHTPGLLATLLVASSVISGGEAATGAGAPSGTPSAFPNLDGLIVDSTEAPVLPATEELPCREKPDTMNMLIVSTMDGAVHALDVANDGAIAWKNNLEGAESPLLSGNLASMQPLTADGESVFLVPSLDGSLYMFSQQQQLLEPIPLSTEMLLHSVRVGDEAVAGGRTMSTTGVDPISGEIRYHCSSQQCEQASAAATSAADGNASARPASTLVFRRTSYAIRAVDAHNGAEKWNLSVSEYDASLAVRGGAGVPVTAGRHVRFLISPPKGVITALDSCGGVLWTRSLGVHIARSWHLNGDDLNEVSIFDSNIHSHQEGINGRPAESLFYLGTINNDPFILYSSKVRKELSRLAASRHFALGSAEEEETGGRGDGRSNALAKYAAGAYKVARGTLDEVLARAFRHSIARQETEQALALEAAATKNGGRRGGDHHPPRQRRDGNDLRVALPATSGDTSDHGACSNEDSLVLIGEENIKSAGYGDPDTDGDQGWFIIRPERKSRRSFVGLLGAPADTCKAFVRKSLRLEEDVNPLWRLLAILLLIVTSALATAGFLRRRWRARRARITTEASTEVSSQPVDDEDQALPRSRAISACPEEVSEDACVKRVAAAADAAVSPAMLVKRTRNESSLSSNGSNCAAVAPDSPMPYQSKFLADFEPLCVLGRGGFGVVFKARNKLDDFPYAVKRISVGNSEKAIERVLREVRAMAQLDHGGIIRYYHTWIERPPEGWQKEKDREIITTMRAARCEVKKSPAAPIPAKEPSLSSDSFSDLDSADAPQGGATEISAPSEDISWMDGSSRDEGLQSSSQASSSSDEDDEVGDQMPALPAHDASLSIVFDYGSGERQSKPSSSSEMSKLGTEMALVTSIDEELLAARGSNNSVFLYIQMQLCMDRTLFAWLCANKRPETRDLDRTRSWMKQMTSAVAYIHQKGLIHRDIKPQNVFFITADTLKIGDLGLVTKCADEATAEAGARVDRSSSSTSLHTGNVGTRGYMSPEQLANRPYTSKVDVFSLGLIATELAVPCQTLMERADVLSGLQQGVQPKQLAASPPEMRDFVAWLTRVDPNERPTCEEIISSPFLLATSLR